MRTSRRDILKILGGGGAALAAGGAGEAFASGDLVPSSRARPSFLFGWAVRTMPVLLRESPASHE